VTVSTIRWPKTVRSERFKVGSGWSNPWLLELLGHQLHHSNDIDLNAVYSRVTLTAAAMIQATKKLGYELVGGLIAGGNASCQSTQSPPSGRREQAGTEGLALPPGPGNTCALRPRPRGSRLIHNGD